ncbi:MFS transporter [Polymorphobacter arshaanensis]|uniref:MFS transporter n=1 Tax=Glacieibacterium arshaanense TaxID=2511025 RepID=A0A4Y9ENM1_9SPHN|nr:MFS transporter [Polymorphobacter arshaanensis]TFU03637.1 MFS transporter [Polymorphobacter arshaanensis]
MTDTAVPARAKGLGLPAWSWALFQGARDPYVILITIYIFTPYFVTTVVGDPVKGQALAASAAKYAGWGVMLLAPILGATVDRMGSRKPWLAGVMMLLIPLIFSLWWTLPDGSGLSPMTVVTITAIIGVLFAFTETLHNALLLPAAGMARAGATSGLALAFGNFVSVGMLIFVLWAFALPGVVDWSFIPKVPMFGLDIAAHQQDRIVAPIVAVAMAIGVLPLFRFVPDVPRTGMRFGNAVIEGAADLVNLFKEARGHRDAMIFLGARMLYTDGLTGILVFGGVYAAGAMGWGTLELLMYGLLLSIVAVGGGLLGGWLDGRLGPKVALRLEITGVIISQLMTLGMTRDTFFYQPWPAADHAPIWDGPMFRTMPEIGLLLAGFVAAITVTSAYASSRTMLTRVVPRDRVGVFFGLFVISGTATSWLAPMLVEMATEAGKSQRIGLLPISGLLLLGLIGLSFVRGGGRVDHHDD